MPTQKQRTSAFRRDVLQAPPVSSASSSKLISVPSIQLRFDSSNTLATPSLAAARSTSLRRPAPEHGPFASAPTRLVDVDESWATILSTHSRPSGRTLAAMVRFAPRARPAANRQSSPQPASFSSRDESDSRTANPARATSALRYSSGLHSERSGTVRKRSAPSENGRALVLDGVGSLLVPIVAEALRIRGVGAKTRWSAVVSPTRPRSGHCEYTWARGS